MREFVETGNHDVWAHLEREFGKGVWVCCWANHCEIPTPRPGLKFEVVEPLEICNSINKHLGMVLPVGKYEVMEISFGSTSHIIRIKDADTGEEIPNPIYIGYTDESQMDWRGIRKIA